MRTNWDDTLMVCECCMLAAVNGDDSSCQGYYEHTIGGPAQDAPDHPTEPGVPSGYVLASDEPEVSGTREYVCDGCGAFLLLHAPRWTFVYLED